MPRLSGPTAPKSKRAGSIWNGRPPISCSKNQPRHRRADQHGNLRRQRADHLRDANAMPEAVGRNIECDRHGAGTRNAGSRFAALEAGQIGNRRRGDIFHRLAREEGLMAGDDDLGEGQQPRQHVVLDDLVRKVLEEDVGFFLIDIQAHRPDLAALERMDQRKRIDEAAAAGIDQHHAVLHQTERPAVDEVVRFGRQRTMQRDDVGAGEQVVQADVAHAGLDRLGTLDRIEGQDLAAEAAKDARRHDADAAGAR
jgi:hypothetical protein